MTRSSGTVVFRFNPQKREPPRRNGLGCHKTERPGLTAPCMIVVCRICHASPARGVFQTADGFGCIAPRYRFAHNGRRIPQGLPRKSVGGREQVSLSTALSSRPDCQHRVKGCVDRSGSLSLIPPLKLPVLAAHLTSLSRGFRIGNTVYSVFKARKKTPLTYQEVSGANVLPLTEIFSKYFS